MEFDILTDEMFNPHFKSQYIFLVNNIIDERILSKIGIRTTLVEDGRTLVYYNSKEKKLKRICSVPLGNKTSKFFRDIYTLVVKDDDINLKVLDESLLENYGEETITKNENFRPLTSASLIIYLLSKGNVYITYELFDYIKKFINRLVSYRGNFINKSIHYQEDSSKINWHGWNWQTGEMT